MSVPKATISHPNLKADTVVLAYMAFKQPNKSRIAYLIPKDKAAWLEYLVWLVKKKTVIKYLSDKSLKKVILRAKPNLMKKFPPPIKDRDVPEPLYWTEQQVADWVGEIGYPHLKNAFLENYINGKRLVNVDASALNAMGLQDFKQIKNLATQIREILQVHRPNMLRAIARQVPFHQFLKYKSKTGPSYDGITFEKFCEDHSYPYQVLRRNKSALISCTTTVVITPASQEGIESEPGSSAEGSEASSEDMSLKIAPSVEFTVRRIVVRNRTIQKIIEELLRDVFDPVIQRKYGFLDMHEIMRRILEEAYLELGFGNPEIYTVERVTFAAGVGESLMRDIMHSVGVLNDIRKFREHLKKETQREDFHPEQIEMVRNAATEFIENVMPIAAMLALGQFSLENVFREEPEFQDYVQSVIDEAEQKTNEFVPEATEFINDVVSEARLRVMARNDFPYLKLEDVRSAKSLAGHILDDLVNESTNIAESLEHAGFDFWQGQEMRYIKKPVNRKLRLGKKFEGHGPVFDETGYEVRIVGSQIKVNTKDGMVVVGHIDNDRTVKSPSGHVIGRLGSTEDIFEYDALPVSSQSVHEVGVQGSQSHGHAIAHGSARDKVEHDVRQTGHEAGTHGSHKHVHIIDGVHIEHDKLVSTNFVPGQFRPDISEYSIRPVMSTPHRTEFSTARLRKMSMPSTLRILESRVLSQIFNVWTSSKKLVEEHKSVKSVVERPSLDLPTQPKT